MSNLLLETEEKHLHREYVTRMLIIYFVLASVLAIIAMVFSLPSYILAESRRGIVEEKLAVLEALISGRQDKGSLEYVAAAKEKMSLLDLENSKHVSTLIERVIALAQGDVKLLSFSLVRRPDIPPLLTIGGISPTRDTLVAFRRSLEKESSFSSVELPVSNFAKDKDIEFSIDLFLK